MAKRKPKPTREETFREKVDAFVNSKQTAEDYLQLMVAYYCATRPDAGLHHDIIRQVLEEKIDGKEIV